ncbi:hypothetical protein KM043_016473 [Ampulex compressa]|nr:hypothetical protein KM043_016473 [Ampulex compressa]
MKNRVLECSGVVGDRYSKREGVELKDNGDVRGGGFSEDGRISREMKERGNGGRKQIVDGWGLLCKMSREEVKEMQVEDIVGSDYMPLTVALRGEGQEGVGKGGGKRRKEREI